MNVSKPGSAASELVAFEVVERGRKGLRVRREVSISFLACLVVLGYFLVYRVWVLARLEVLFGA